jgi:hypothetical protein
MPRQVPGACISSTEANASRFALELFSLLNDT